MKMKSEKTYTIHKFYGRSSRDYYEVVECAPEGAQHFTDLSING